ncbi:MAG: sarcosine oxidase subunit delta [Pseudomonadota bacterium]
MIRIDCPFCGVRDHTEFSYEGDATVTYPALDASEEAWFEAVFLRDNPRGPHREYWRHVFGCGAFLEVERDTLTHEITSVKMAHPGWAAAVREQGDGAP